MRYTTFPGWVPLLGVTAVIGVLSVVPPPTMPTGEFEFGDKINHCAAMATVVVLTIRAVRWQRGAHDRRREIFSAVLYALALSVLIEVVQGWLPNRSSDLLDLLADGAGILLGLLTALVLDRTRLGRLLLGPPTRRGGTPPATE